MGRSLGLDPEEVQRLYQSGLSMQDVADRLGCTRPAIWHLMHRCGLQARTRSQARRLALARGKLKVQDGSSLAASYHWARKHRGLVCEECGVAEDLNIHHVDGDPRNNDSTNLQTLCRRCHKALHAMVR